MIKAETRTISYDGEGNAHYSESVQNLHQIRGEEYCRMYCENLGLFGEVKSLVTMKLFLELMGNAGYNEPRVHICQSDREAFMSRCSVSKVSYYAAVKELIQLGVIIAGKYVEKNSGDMKRLGAGEFLLNPRIVWRGTTDARNSAIVEYDNCEAYERR